MVSRNACHRARNPIATGLHRVGADSGQARPSPRTLGRRSETRKPCRAWSHRQHRVAERVWQITVRALRPDRHRSVRLIPTRNASIRGAGHSGDRCQRKDRSLHRPAKSLGERARKVSKLPVMRLVDRNKPVIRAGWLQRHQPAERRGRPPRRSKKYTQQEPWTTTGSETPSGRDHGGRDVDTSPVSTAAKSQAVPQVNGENMPDIVSSSEAASPGRFRAATRLARRQQLPKIAVG